MAAVCILCEGKAFVMKLFNRSLTSNSKEYKFIHKFKSRLQWRRTVERVHFMGSISRTEVKIRRLLANHLSNISQSEA